MKHTLLILPFLAATAWAQEDPYKSLGLGDRVQVTFRSGGTITGQLVLNPIGRAVKPAKLGAVEPEEKIDYVKETAVTVDLSWEYPGLDGTMTILKKEIKDIKKLQNLDKDTLDRLRKQKEEIRADLERQNRQNKAEADAKEKATMDAMRKEAKAKRELEGKAAKEAKDAANAKKLEILKQFPPDQWGPDKLKDIAAKNDRKQPLSEQEKAFMGNFGAWQEAINILSEAAKNDKKETPPEEKKP